MNAANELWSQRYKPISKCDLIHKYNIKLIQEWIKRYEAKDPTMKKALIVSGKRGIGKTSIVTLVCKSLKAWSCTIYDSNRSRNKRFMDEVVRKQRTNVTLSVVDNQMVLQRPVIVIDDLDAMNNASDFGGIAELVKIINSLKGITSIKKSDKAINDNTWHSPIILICNDVHSNKYSDLIKECDIIEFKEVTPVQLLELAESTDNKLDEDATLDIAKTCNGDIRLFLDSLQISNQTLKCENKFHVEVREVLDMHLYKRVKRMIVGKLNCSELMNDFYVDQSMIPVMVNENVYKFIDDSSDQMEITSEISHWYSDADIIAYKIFQQTKFQLIDFYGVASCVAPVASLKSVKADVSISFPLILTKNACIHANKKAVTNLYRSASMQFDIFHFTAFRKYILSLLSRKATIPEAVNILKCYGVTPDTIFNCIKVRSFDPTPYKSISTIKFKKNVAALYDSI